MLNLVTREEERGEVDRKGGISNINDNRAASRVDQERHKGEDEEELDDGTNVEAAR